MKLENKIFKENSSLGKIFFLLVEILMIVRFKRGRIRSLQVNVALLFTQVELPECQKELCFLMIVVPGLQKLNKVDLVIQVSQELNLLVISHYLMLLLYISIY